MIETSAAFDQAARAITRRPVARVDIVWSDPIIDPNVEASASEQNRISYPQQVVDLETVVPFRWAYLHDDLKADAGFRVMPDDATGPQVGWFGSQLSDIAGQLDSPASLFVTFAPRPVLVVQVVGDSAYGEYPVDFDVLLYSAGDTLEHTVSVEGNELLNWSASVAELSTITKMELRIYRWSKAGAVVKIAEFYTAVTESYDGRDIVRADLLEERELAESSLPTGNISANELDLELQNIRLVRSDAAPVYDPFTPANSAAPLHQLIRPNRKITLYLGFVLPDRTGTELLRMGTFWSGDWDVSETQPTAITSARDRMELLRRAEYEAGQLFQFSSIATIADTILTHGRDTIPMPDLVWSIDPALQSIILPVAWFEPMSYMAVLRKLAEACQGVAYMDKNDVLRLELQ